MTLDTASEIAAALDSRASSSSAAQPKRRRTASKPKKAKCRRPHRESTKTITNRLYSLWAQIVKQKAGNKCVVCGVENSQEHPLNAHHIMPRQNFSGLRFDPENGIALCPKCHKMGKFSAHKGGVWFGEWLRSNVPEKYAHVLAHKDDELNCKDRETLYRVEVVLHNEHESIIGRLPVYIVTAILRDGNPVSPKVSANNPKMAEFEMATRYPVKGIVSVKKI